MTKDSTPNTQLTIHARNIHLGERVQDYIRSKFGRLERHLRPMSDAEMEISGTSARSPGDRVVAQLTLTANGRVLRGQERAASVEEAVDQVTDVLDRQIRRYKTKFYRTSLGRRSARSAPDDEVIEAPLELEEEGSEDEAAGTVIRTKQFPMAPMRVEDAIEEMEMVSHSFFLFFNLEAQEFNVVYRRRDGDYGLLRPQLID